ncbi:MAG TPA: hypothetical protein VF157_09500 [Chloroflexota bacterium]
MVSLYLDDCIASPNLARALRASGLSVFLPSDVGIKGRNDPLHLEKATELGACLVTKNMEKATELGACLVTKNIGDFMKLHGLWREQGRIHGGLLVNEDLKLGEWVNRLRRAGHGLSPEIARATVSF